ncbi:universal stress protein [Roseibium hamelinense]|uniref:universal stress protein n=1 Tax=Roseibium hamelinense TaxID=150831 RepID=UPI0011AB092D|nr:universal stress protein [Roseibium hamelinense]MTI45075.1 universal stress protein [Roseibium hamelinense]
MFEKIMVPVDLAHADKLEKALTAAAGLAKANDTPVTYVAVTTSLPGKLAHNPEEFAAKLDGFAQQQGSKFGIKTDARSYVSHDPTIDLDATLIRAVKETGADVVVMATHIPNVADHFWPSNGGTVATHTDASVFLIRGH